MTKAMMPIKEMIIMKMVCFDIIIPILNSLWHLTFIQAIQNDNNENNDNITDCIANVNGMYRYGNYVGIWPVTN